jgi:hypothetical protein
MSKIQRVPKGEKYYVVHDLLNDSPYLLSFIDEYLGSDDEYFETGNYFTTQKEAAKFLYAHAEELNAIRDAAVKSAGDIFKRRLNDGTI